jgi:Raf kinase inhibitor-like YbhB/YbcL family protein
MKITSPSFEDQGEYPVIYTCDGEDIHPRLEFIDLPVGTKSIALVLEDTDHLGEVFTHWTIWNIPANNPFIEEDLLPEGVVEGLTSFGVCGYRGPCPKNSDHRYVFRAYALDAMLDLPVNSSRDDFDNATSVHVLEIAEVSVFYPEKYLYDKDEI